MWWGMRLLACGHPEVPVDTSVVRTSNQALVIDVEDATAWSLTLVADGPIRVRSLLGPMGEGFIADDLVQDEYLTAAVLDVGEQTVLQWPVVPDDSLSPGAWTVELSTDGTGTLTQKTDRWRGGRVAVQVLTDRSPADLEPGIDQARRIWRRAGIDLDVSVASAELPGSLPDVVVGDALYTELSGRTPDALVVVLGGVFAGDPNLVAVSGGVPGSVHPGPRSAVVVSMEAIEGPDGTLSEGESDELGFTLAHEIGHYLGLFHPVELSFDQYDALDDTPRCQTLSDCRDQLGDNLMFPLACVDCRPRWTDEQVGVLEHAVWLR